jgi:uncharacterized protein YoxC
MELSGQQIKKLRQGLQAAISKDELTFLLREELEWRSGDIFASTDKDSIAFSKLIEHAEAQGSIAHLVFSVLRYNSSNDKFNEFVQEWIQQQEGKIDNAVMLNLLGKADLAQHLNSIVSGKSLNGLYLRDVEYLADSQCNHIYAQALLVNLICNFPEMRLDRLDDIEEENYRVQVAHLMFVFHEYGANGKQIRILPSLWLSRKREDAVLLPSASRMQGVVCSKRLKDVAQQVQLLVDEAEDVLDKVYQFGGDISVHFFVSLKSLYTEWDQLKCLENGKVAISEDYPVVVRAKERYEQARYRRELRKLWQQMSKNAAGRSCCIDCNENVPKNVIGVQWKGRFRSQRQSKEAFEQILRQGIPMAAWLRCTSDEMASEQANVIRLLEGLLNIQAIQNPDNWFQELRQIRENSCILSKHLAVWWDDPEFCPDLLGFGEEAGESA